MSGFATMGSTNTTPIADTGLFALAAVPLDQDEPSDPNERSATRIGDPDELRRKG